MKKVIIIVVVAALLIGGILLYINHNKKEAAKKGESGEGSESGENAGESSGKKIRSTFRRDDTTGETIEGVTSGESSMKMIVNDGNGGKPTQVAELNAETNEIEFRPITPLEAKTIENGSPEQQIRQAPELQKIKEVKHPVMKKIIGAPSKAIKKVTGKIFHKKKKEKTDNPKAKGATGLLNRNKNAGSKSNTKKGGMFKRKKS